MASWNSLTNDQQRQFARNLVQRCRSYVRWTRCREIDADKDVLLIADRPGPGAPKSDAYHHTPFYAKTYSGGFLNAELVLAGIPETRLFWENSANRHGAITSPELLSCHRWSHILALGNNADRWLRLNGITTHTKVLHPQAHKRFHASKPYALIELLKEIHGT